MAANITITEERPVPRRSRPGRRRSIRSRVFDVVQAYGVLLGLLALLVVMFAPSAIIAINCRKDPTDPRGKRPIVVAAEPHHGQT